MNIKPIINLVKCMVILILLTICFSGLYNFEKEAVPKCIDGMYQNSINELDTELQEETDSEQKEYINYKIQEMKMEWYQRKSNHYVEAIFAIMIIPTVAAFVLLIIISSKFADSFYDVFYEIWPKHKKSEDNGTSIRHS